jgi:1-phosphofructokinase
VTLGFQHCGVAVFAPSPILTVTVESGPEGGEVHFHPGGQGFWVARLAASLGARVSLCVPLGGESGDVLRALLDAEGIEVLAVRTGGANAAYLHDRRSGERRPIVETQSPGLGRHELDELYGVAVTAGLASDAMLLTGPRHEHVLPAETYTRLAADLRANGQRVLVDLSGEPLRAALRGGIDVLKLSVEELQAEGFASGGGRAEVGEAIRQLSREGAESVLVSCGPDPALALVGERLLEIVGPRFTEVDARGAGDSMFAALGVGLAAGLEREESLRLAVAASALNVTRHGLGSGHLKEIERLLGQVRACEVAPGGQEEATASIDSSTVASNSAAMPGTEASVNSERDE